MNMDISVDAVCKLLTTHPMLPNVLAINCPEYNASCNEQDVKEEVHWTLKRFTFWLEAIALPILYATQALVPAVSLLLNCHPVHGERPFIFK
uniref:Uncharacterized protein n=1 Tax=Romanomermis culicivorax TaxID=13658 RepID=A0A915KPE5_ROMCU